MTRKLLCRTPAAWMLLSVISAAVVVILTLTPGRTQLIDLIHRVLDRVWWGDLIGHTALMGVFTAIVFTALRIGVRSRFTHALVMAVFTAFMVSEITEVMQRFTEGRTPDRADLMANLLGVFIAATVICYLKLRVLLTVR